MSWHGLKGFDPAMFATCEKASTAMHEAAHYVCAVHWQIPVDEIQTDVHHGAVTFRDLPECVAELRASVPPSVYLAGMRAQTAYAAEHNPVLIAAVRDGWQSDEWNINEYRLSDHELRLCTQWTDALLALNWPLVKQIACCLIAHGKKVGQGRVIAGTQRGRLFANVAKALETPTAETIDSCRVRLFTKSVEDLLGRYGNTKHLPSASLHVPPLLNRGAQQTYGPV